MTQVDATTPTARRPAHRDTGLSLTQLPDMIDGLWHELRSSVSGRLVANTATSQAAETTEGSDRGAPFAHGSVSVDEAHVIIDSDDRYLVANDLALLDLAIEIIGCLHDRDRLKRPRTALLKLTDLDAGVTALYDAIAHLDGDQHPHRGHAVDNRRHRVFAPAHLLRHAPWLR
jgi:hypothetical protein